VAEEEIYRRFIDWLNRTWWGVPESPELLPLIKTRYTAEEASLLTGLPYSPKNLDELAALKKMDPAELRVHLDALAKKGLVLRDAHGGAARYALNDSFFVFLRSAFWPGKSDAGSKAMAPLTNRYFFHGFFDQFAGVHVSGLRTLPVKETIADPRSILPYEDMAQFVDAQDYFTVSTCPCRHRKNLDPESPDCRHPTENCLHFGRLGHYAVENGLGREITRGDAHRILREAAESGLVHGLSNQQRGADTICNCCGCCCMWFEGYQKLKHIQSLDPSNYEVRPRPATCKGCGLCVQRCPMKALRLETSPEAKNKTGKVAVLNAVLCLGCGVCAFKCPTNSLALERRPATKEPPADGREWMERFLADRRRIKK
jgi:Na+-translocating ferredoxin:NAD+ oxidoreductase subunit B